MTSCHTASKCSALFLSRIFTLYHLTQVGFGRDQVEFKFIGQVINGLVFLKQDIMVMRNEVVYLKYT